MKKGKTNTINEFKSPKEEHMQLAQPNVSFGGQNELKPQERKMNYVHLPLHK